MVMPESPTSRELRRFMLELVDAFGTVAVGQGLPRFVPERLGRFDQQVTSKFHRDGAPAASLLVLGYEPTSVRSQLFVADAECAARDEGMTVAAFLSANNPMFPAGEHRLSRYITEVVFPQDVPCVVLINNSLSTDDIPECPLGVLHKAVIRSPDPAARRVINSVGLMYAGETSTKMKTREEIEHFKQRDDLD
ncbi:hypothetical protein FRUB_00923 [Fimbriiglobus ruber]|uniref:Uncharacterized protein n=1 Tax=Fimbriiglobus ruber TaxID=1908690 RepID=A0A225E630_9BACT|nr:hypothetical protein FRUB_00923 [Fimbriiglobus ruber]